MFIQADGQYNMCCPARVTASFTVHTYVVHLFLGLIHTKKCLIKGFWRNFLLSLNETTTKCLEVICLASYW